MKASYEFTPDDLAAFARFHYAQSPSARRQRVGGVLVGFGALLLLPGVILLTSKKPLVQTAFDIWPLLLGPLLWLIFATSYIKLRADKLSKRVLSEGENAGFYGPCLMSLETDGLRESKRSGDTIRRWAAVEKIIVSGQHLFVYTSGVEAFVVPRRAFGTDHEFTAFAQRIADMAGVAIQQA